MRGLWIVITLVQALLLTYQIMVNAHPGWIVFHSILTAHALIMSVVSED